jgi:hypothetical protein
MKIRRQFRRTLCGLLATTITYAPLLHKDTGFISDPSSKQRQESALEKAVALICPQSVLAYDPDAAAYGYGKRQMIEKYDSLLRQKKTLEELLRKKGFHPIGYGSLEEFVSQLDLDEEGNPYVSYIRSIIVFHMANGDMYATKNNPFIDTDHRSTGRTATDDSKRIRIRHVDINEVVEGNKYKMLRQLDDIGEQDYLLSKDINRVFQFARVLEPNQNRTFKRAYAKLAEMYGGEYDVGLWLIEQAANAGEDNDTYWTNIYDQVEEEAFGKQRYRDLVSLSQKVGDMPSAMGYSWEEVVSLSNGTENGTKMDHWDDFYALSQAFSYLKSQLEDFGDSMLSAYQTDIAMLYSKWQSTAMTEEQKNQVLSHSYLLE